MFHSITNLRQEFRIWAVRLSAPCPCFLPSFLLPLPLTHLKMVYLIMLVCVCVCLLVVLNGWCEAILQSPPHLNLWRRSFRELAWTDLQASSWAVPQLWDYRPVLPQPAFSYVGAGIQTQVFMLCGNCFPVPSEPSPLAPFLVFKIFCCCCGKICLTFYRFYVCIVLWYRLHSHCYCSSMPSPLKPRISS